MEIPRKYGGSVGGSIRQADGEFVVPRFEYREPERLFLDVFQPVDATELIRGPAVNLMAQAAARARSRQALVPLGVRVRGQTLVEMSWLDDDIQVRLQMGVRGGARLAQWNLKTRGR